MNSVRYNILKEARYLLENAHYWGDHPLCWEVGIDVLSALKKDLPDFIPTFNERLYGLPIKVRSDMDRDEIFLVRLGPRGCLK